MDDVPTEADALEVYRSAALGIRNCLRLGDQVADCGNAISAADYLIGALDDLGPELASLRAFLASNHK